MPPNTYPNLFELAHIENGMTSHFCDIRDPSNFTKIVRDSCPEIIFHLAAQPLVHASYRDPLATYNSNIMGTAYLLDAIRGLGSAKVAVMVTTDKVYLNNEWFYPYRETDSLGGYDPYSASKAASEIVIASYRDSFLAEQGVAIATARAGNVMGGGDWSEDRLIPDAVRAWQASMSLEIRRPQAIRPWQHVLEPLHGYLILAKKLWEHPELAGAYNFGPNTHEVATVREVIERARSAFGGGDINYGAENKSFHEAGWLALETSKAREVLGTYSKWSLTDTIDRTMSWYKAHQQGADARSLCAEEISAFEAEI